MRAGIPASTGPMRHALAAGLHRVFVPACEARTQAPAQPVEIGIDADSGAAGGLDNGDRLGSFGTRWWRLQRFSAAAPGAKRRGYQVIPIDESNTWCHRVPKELFTPMWSLVCRFGAGLDRDKRRTSECLFRGIRSDGSKRFSFVIRRVIFAKVDTNYVNRKKQVIELLFSGKEWSGFALAEKHVDAPGRGCRPSAPSHAHSKSAGHRVDADSAVIVAAVRLLRCLDTARSALIQP